MGSNPFPIEPEMEITFRRIQARYRRRPRMDTGRIAVLLRELAGMWGLVVSMAALGALLAELVTAL